ncbi:uncharacterized protein LOC118200190 [Stegodyphus dumicola]|uniref:uncharacterized protein LOC118200190 n=1 Tax=Stegodyphus dumicola TaxID=202533 RepID=UPI0015AA734B|nr:uncharacterized protein LOC118200190 [Stegodyphus dumicola]
MSSTFLFLIVVYLCMLINFSQTENFEVLSRTGRNLLSQIKKSNHTHNETKETKNIPSSVKEEDSMAGTEAAVLIIVVIVVLAVIGMVVYFVRKFDQLNRTLPTYRYSSLKTEINGVYGPDDKTESQALVNVSTEEEDDYDDDEEEDVSPPTLLVRSQTVMSNKAVNGSIPVPIDRSLMSSEMTVRSEDATIDSDDELLQ